MFNALLETLAELVGRDRSADIIDGTLVREHHCAARIKKMLGRPRGSADHGEGSQPNAMPAATPGCYRSPSS
ncbi:hypothetical protein GCM10007207_28350 [Asaia siamensis]|uniref:Transposase n=1 Tax=Asaia siamensis TaxID=110479 RepID=A0ABQ1MN74_9PROT|nr:hypothetical protein GCM10007207_28350 [Asaia siamensis]